MMTVDLVDEPVSNPWDVLCKVPPNGQSADFYRRYLHTVEDVEVGDLKAKEAVLYRLHKLLLDAMDRDTRLPTIPITR